VLTELPFAPLPPVFKELMTQKESLPRTSPATADDDVVPAADAHEAEGSTMGQ
jgi:hypothetical protein